jgi:hypothetical protein
MIKKLIIPATVLLIVVPIGINILVQLPSIFPLFGSSKDWFEFFGSYFGGAIGALVAVYIAFRQVDAAKVEFEKKLAIEREQREIEENQQHRLTRQENRMYINFEYKWTEWNLESKNIINNSKIIYTYDYQQRERTLKKDKKNITTFAKISLLGSANFILDCKISLKVKDFRPELKINNLGEYHDPAFVNGELNFHIPLITSEDVIFIPLTNCFLKYKEEPNYYQHDAYDVVRFEIDYLTPVNERIQYI